MNPEQQPQAPVSPAFNNAAQPSVGIPHTQGVGHGQKVLLLSAIVVVLAALCVFFWLKVNDKVVAPTDTAVLENAEQNRTSVKITVE